MADVDVSPVISPFTLGAPAAGLGVMPLGCLDHNGYSMANEKDFYTKFIVELVPNITNHATYYVSDLEPVKPKQPRFDVVIFNPVAKWAINAADGMNVLYSQDPLGKGKVSSVEEVWQDNKENYQEARAWAYHDQVRPRLIHFPLPATPERYMWIDLSWPVRNILLPISQVSYPGEKPNCTYAQIEFRHLTGLLAIDGWTTTRNSRTGKATTREACFGLDHKFVPGHIIKLLATLRVDLDALYKHLTLPRHMRKEDFNVMAPLQLHRWDRVTYNPLLPMNTGETTEWGTYVSNYELTSNKRSRKSSEGVKFDQLVSEISGVNLEYPPPPQNVLINILNTVVSIGLGFIPVIGPLLAIGSDLAFKVLEDPNSLEVKDLLTGQFGIELAGAIIESALGYQGMKRPNTRAADAPPAGTMPKPLYFGESLDGYKINPNIMDPTEAEKADFEKFGPKTDGEDPA